MLYGGKTHTAHRARVRHAWDARLEAGEVHKLDPDTSAGRDLEVNRRAFDRLSEAIEEVKDKLTSAEFKEL